MRFFKCAICGQIIEIIEDSGITPVCCGQEMEELIPGTTDAAPEKHVPVISMEGSKVIVKVGSVPHPMVKEHCVEWIALQTKCGSQRRTLKPDETPQVCFRICGGDEVKAAYAYCNLHGLWKVECGG